MEKTNGTLFHTQLLLSSWRKVKAEKVIRGKLIVFFVPNIFVKQIKPIEILLSSQWDQIKKFGIFKWNDFPLIFVRFILIHYLIAGSILRDLITVPQERRGPSFTTRQESRQTLSNLQSPSSPPSRLMEVNTNKEPFSRILLEKFAEFTQRNILPLDRKLPIAHEIMKIVEILFYVLTIWWNYYVLLITVDALTLTVMIDIYVFVIFPSVCFQE